MDEIEKEGNIRHWKKGDVWYPRVRYPQKDISIREAGESWTIIKEDGSTLGKSASSRVMRELHPGALYLHRGAQFMVATLDLAERKAFCRPAEDINYYTRPISREDTEIISVSDKKELKKATVNLGMLRVTERIIGYWKKDIRTREIIGEYPLALPPSIFTTMGVWMEVNEDVLDLIQAKKYGRAGSLHAAEHAAIASLPLFALCDRMDLGGVSYPFNPELGSAAIFIYDGHAGGVGLTKRGLECVEEWFFATIRLMEECPCETACPSCTHDPQCGNNNEPLDKRGAIMILNNLLGND